MGTAVFKRSHTFLFAHAPRVWMAVALLLTSLSGAHGVMIAATVNNKAITTQDLEKRILLAMISSGMPNTAEVFNQLKGQILDMMINEQIQLQMGKEYDIKIDEAAIQGAVRDIEQQNNMPEGGLKQMLAKNNIPFELMKTHLEASIIWREYVRERFKNLVQVSDSDVERAQKELKSTTGETRFHLAEIVLYFDNPQEAVKAKVQADRIVAQMSKGARFSMLANQFSQAPSASRGGDIGWIPASKLDAAVVSKINQLGTNGISQPIQTEKEFRIYLVRDRLEAGQFARPTSTISFKQVSISVPTNAFAFEIEESLKQVASLARQVTSCRGVESLTARKKAVVQDVKDMPLENLPPELRKILDKTPVNRASQPVFTGTGAMFFVVCDKKTTNPQEPSKEDIQAQLVNAKLQSVAGQELRTRRGGAHIDIR